MSAYASLVADRCCRSSRRLREQWRYGGGFTIGYASNRDDFSLCGRVIDGCLQSSRHLLSTVQFNFAGTPTLVTQIEQGAPADVFASADTTNMDRLTAEGFTTGTPQVFARNQLEIVVAPGNPKGITGLADLARPGVIYVSEAPTVPAGKYSLQALAQAGVTVTPRSLETDVKFVVSKIELGEADAGIVYVTDVKAAGSRVQGIPIPDASNVFATYPLITVKGTKNADVANAFIALVLSRTGQSTLETYGFLGA
jgi:molybdate transport system substrate-binding protein